MVNRNSIGDKLYQLRTARNETLESAAESAGISHVSLSRYENGYRMPRMDILERIANHYNVTVDEILGRSTPNDSDEPQDDAWAIRERLRRDPAYRLLFDAADSASPEHLRAAAAMLKALEPKEDDS